MNGDGTPTVAMVGTFDLGNFGDVLFPVLAEHELRRRVPGVELVAYSYREMGSDAWPYDVRSLGRLPAELHQAAALVVGGGHLARFRGPLAPGYGPTDSVTRDPTGVWLDPTLAALACGVPVIWSAIGLHGDTPGWARPLLREAVRDIAHLAVRDQYSAAQLAELDPALPVRLVPDTAFAAADLVPGDPTGEWRELAGGEGYVVVQPSPLLAEQRELVTESVGAARDAGLRIVELPISPALGDRCGLLSLPEDARRVERWPDPRLLLEIVARSEGVVALSLHLSIAGAACGVPVYRPPSAPGEKYELVEGLSGVHVWDGGAPRFGRGAPGQDVQELAGQVSAHWDRVAELVEGPPADGRRPVPAFVTTLSTAFHDAAALADRIEELERQAGKLEEYKLYAAELEGRLEALQARKSVRAALRAAGLFERSSGS